MRVNGSDAPTTNGLGRPKEGSAKPHTRVAQTVEELIRHIVDQGLVPGDRLPTERELIQSLSISRSVVREALRELQVQQVVEARHGHGIFVRPYGRELAADVLSGPGNVVDALRDLSEARAAIEEAAAGYASGRATETDREDLHEIVAAMYEAGRSGVVRRELDLEFHKVLVRSARNPYLLRFSAVIAEQFFLKRTLVRSADSQAHMLHLAHQHRDLLRLLVRGSAADLQAAMRVHIFGPLWAAVPEDDSPPIPSMLREN